MLQFDYRFALDMWSQERELGIYFQTTLVVRWPTSEAQRFDPEETQLLAPLLSFLHQPVKTFTVSSDGECALVFQDGTRVESSPDEEYEAWEAHGRELAGNPPSFHLICNVAGGLVEFPPSAAVALPEWRRTLNRCLWSVGERLRLFAARWSR